MGPVVPFIPLIAAAIGAGATIYSSKKQERAAEEAQQRVAQTTQSNIENIQAETEEVVERVEYTAGRERSLARAKAFASGAVGETPSLYLEEMARLSGDEVDWLKKSGYSQMEIESLEGRNVSEMVAASATNSQASTISQGVQQASTWFRAFG